MLFANNKCADQPAHDKPVHLHSLISTFVIRFLDSTVVVHTKPNIWPALRLSRLVWVSSGLTFPKKTVPHLFCLRYLWRRTLATIWIIQISMETVTDLWMPRSTTDSVYKRCARLAAITMKRSVCSLPMPFIHVIFMIMAWTGVTMQIFKAHAVRISVFTQNDYSKPRHEKIWAGQFEPCLAANLRTSQPLKNRYLKRTRDFMSLTSEYIRAGP